MKKITTHSLEGDHDGQKNPSLTSRLSATDRMIVSQLQPTDDHDIGPVEEIPLDGPLGTVDRDEPATTSRHIKTKDLRKLRSESKWFQSSNPQIDRREMRPR